MKKGFYILFIFLIAFGKVFGQTNSYTRADSIILTNKTKTAVLVIQNATKDTTGGFLKNIGKGVTKFDKVKISDIKGLSDSLSKRIFFSQNFKYVDSVLDLADTLKIKNLILKNIGSRSSGDSVLVIHNNFVYKSKRPFPIAGYGTKLNGDTIKVDSVAIIALNPLYKQNGFIFLNKVKTDTVQIGVGISISDNLVNLGAPVTVGQPFNIDDGHTPGIYLRNVSFGDKWHIFSDDTTRIYHINYFNNITHTEYQELQLDTVDGGTLRDGHGVAYLKSGGGGGGGTWGSITGILSSQTDLQSALDAKQNHTGLSNDEIMFANGSGVMSQDATLVYKNGPHTLLNSATQDTTKTLVGTGDSIIAGIYMTNAADRYINRLADGLGYKIDNQGVSGSTLNGQTGSQIPTYSSSIHSYLLINYGTNDINHGYNDSQFRSDLTAFIGFATAKGWPTSKIKIISLPGYQIQDGYASDNLLCNTAMSDIATSTSCEYIDLYTPMLLGKLGRYDELSDDNIHPNEGLGSYTIFKLISSHLSPKFGYSSQGYVSGTAVEATSIKLRNYSYSDNASLVGIDKYGNMLPLYGIPARTVTRGKIYLGGALLGANAPVQVGTDTTQDIALGKNATIWGSNSTIYGSIKLMNDDGATNITNNYTGGEIDFNVNLGSGPVKTFYIDPNSTVYSKIGFGIKPGSAYYLDQSNTTEGYGRVQPFDDNEDFNLRLSSAAGSFNIFTSGGTALSQVQMQRIFVNGDVLFQKAGTFTDIPSAIVSFNSTSQGIAPPTMTTTQKNAISSPVERLTVYDNTVHAISYYNGSVWVNVGASSTPSLQSVATIGNSYTGHIQMQALEVTGTAGAGYADMISQSASPSSTSGHIKIYSDSLNRLSWKNPTYRRTLQVPYPSDYTARFPYRVTGTTLEDSTHASTTYQAIGTYLTPSSTNVVTNKDFTSGTNTFPTFTAAAGTLTGTTLNSTVVSSSLTSANLATLTATDATLTLSGSYNGNTARTVGINLANSNNFTSGQTVSISSLGTTNGNGFTLINPTTTTSGVTIQNSPSLLLGSRIFNTGTSSDNSANVQLYVSPVSAASPTLFNFRIDASANGAAFGNILNLNSFGSLTTTNYTAISSNAGTSTSTLGIGLTNSSPSTSGATVQNSTVVSWHGSNWNTTATAAANYFDWKVGARGTSAATPATTWVLSSSQGTSSTTPSYTDRLTVDNGGNLTMSGAINSGGGFQGTGLNTSGNGQTLSLQTTRTYSSAMTAVNLLGGSVTNSTGQYNGVSITNTFNQTSTAGGTDFTINRTNTAIGSGNQYFIDAQVSASSKFHVDYKGSIVSNGTLSFANPTAGTLGTDSILVHNSGGQVKVISANSYSLVAASNDITAQTAAGNITTVTSAASNSTYDVGGYINVTAIATDVIQAQVTFTDENNTSQTISLASISAVGFNSIGVQTIRVKASTTITLKTNLTTGVGTITFDAGGYIKKDY